MKYFDYIYSKRKYIIIGLISITILLYVIYIKKKKNKKGNNNKLITPIVNYKFTSPYGQRGGKLHNGVDLAAPIGTPIRASVDSIVNKVWTDSESGNALKLDSLSDKSISFGYAHLNKPSHLKEGDKISKGDIIGYVGNTGRSTGAHLHWVIRKDNQYINPETIIKLR